MPEVTESFIQWNAESEGKHWGEFYASVYNRQAGGRVIYPTYRELAQNAFGQLEGISRVVMTFDAQKRMAEKGKFVAAFIAAFERTLDLKS